MPRLYGYAPYYDHGRRYTPPRRHRHRAEDRPVSGTVYLGTRGPDSRSPGYGEWVGDGYLTARGAEALEHNGPGESTTWEDQDSGAEVTITPTFSFDRQGYCREFWRKVYTAGELEKLYLFACREEDGRWRVVR